MSEGSIRERLAALSRGELIGLVALLAVTLGGAGLWYVRSLPRPVEVSTGRAAAPRPLPPRRPRPGDPRPGRRRGLGSPPRRVRVHRGGSGDRRDRRGGRGSPGCGARGAEPRRAARGRHPGPRAEARGRRAGGRPCSAGRRSRAASINVNTATAAELEALPGVGEVIAQAIVDYRTENGPFALGRRAARRERDRRRDAREHPGPGHRVSAWIAPGARGRVLGRPARCTRRRRASPDPCGWLRAGGALLPPRPASRPGPVRGGRVARAIAGSSAPDARSRGPRSRPRLVWAHADRRCGCLAARARRARRCWRSGGGACTSIGCGTRCSRGSRGPRHRRGVAPSRSRRSSADRWSAVRRRPLVSVGRRRRGRPRDGLALAAATSRAERRSGRPPPGLGLGASRRGPGVRRRSCCRRGIVAELEVGRGRTRSVPRRSRRSGGRSRSGRSSAVSIGSLFPAREAGLLMGLALGDDSRLDPGLERDFRATGLSHLLVVSGENVAMVLAPMLALGPRCGCPGGRGSRSGSGRSRSSSC